jgi:hypothetical protein
MNLTVEQKVINAINRHPEWSNGRLAKGISGSNVAMVAMARNSMPKIERPKVEPKSPAGLDAFKKMFSPLEIQNRRIKRKFSAVDKILESSEFKRREWMPDDEMREKAVLSRADWVMVKKEYSEYIVEDCRDENNKKYDAWVVLDKVDEARRIKEGIY